MTDNAPPATRSGGNDGLALADTLDVDALHAGKEPEPSAWFPAAVLRIAIPFGPTNVPTELPVAVSSLHSAWDCRDTPCGLHGRPSPHLLASQPMRLRFEFTDRGTRALPSVVERLCPRVPSRWHADVDSLMYLSSVLDPARYALIRAGDDGQCGCTASVELDLVMRELPVPPAAASVLGIRTQNSVYEAALRDGRVRRTVGVNPPTPCFTPDGRWKPVSLLAQPRVAESWLVHHANGMSCVSSCVIDVEVLASQAADPTW